MINPNAPAYPQGSPEMVIPGQSETDTQGLTVRAEIASRLMAGYLSNSLTTTTDDDKIAGWAVDSADALIERLNKE